LGNQLEHRVQDARYVSNYGIKNLKRKENKNIKGTIRATIIEVFGIYFGDF
jgi:hypothetical protein